MSDLIIPTALRGKGSSQVYKFLMMYIIELANNFKVECAFGDADKLDRFIDYSVDRIKKKGAELLGKDQFSVRMQDQSVYVVGGQAQKEMQRNQLLETTILTAQAFGSLVRLYKAERGDARNSMNDFIEFSKKYTHDHFERPTAIATK